MKIDRIELFHVAVPLAKPFYPAWIPGYPQTVNRFTLLRLTTDDGVQGISAGMAFEREREGLGGLLGPYLIGLDPCDIATVRQRIREASYLGWRNYWLEAACWDIKGKNEGKPVWALLGGEPVERVEVYASTGEVHPPDQRADEVLKLHELGFKTVKLRVKDFDFTSDIAQVAAVREAVGDSMAIGVDANQGWPVTLIEAMPIWDLARASEFATACADYDVGWLEEPLDMHAYDDLAALRTQSQVPIAGAELNAGWHEYKIMFEKGCFDVYQPDAVMGGGIGDALKVIEACRAHGVHFSPHTWTNGIEFIINLHVHVAGDGSHPLEYPYEPPGWVPAVRDGVLAEPILVDTDGTVSVPQEPGLGIEIDEDKLARWGEKFFEMTSSGLAVKTIREKGLFTALKLSRKKNRK